MDLADLGVRRVLVLTDAAVSRLPPVETVLRSLEENHVACVVYDRVRIEPNDAVVPGRDRVRRAQSHLRRVRRRRRRLDDRHRQGRQPLHDVSAGRLSGLREPADWQGARGPWTAQAADGDSDDRRHRQRDHRRQRVRPDASPRQDRNLQPPAEADARLPRSGQHPDDAGAGCRIERPRHPQPRGRVVHRAALHRAAAAGSAVAAAVRTRARIRSATSGRSKRSAWCRAFSCAAVDDPSDDEARANMLLAASYAGVGFGNAGVHLPHAMSYPVAGHVRTYRAPGYVTDHPLVPHGLSVILNAPAVFRFTAASSPQRHLQAADALGVEIAHSSARRSRAGLSRIGSPGSCSGSGSPTACARLATPRRTSRRWSEGTLLQRRLTTLSPRPAGVEELTAMFEEAMVAW